MDTLPNTLLKWNIIIRYLAGFRLRWRRAVRILCGVEENHRIRDQFSDVPLGAVFFIAASAVAATDKDPATCGQVVAAGLRQTIEADHHVGFDVFLVVPGRILPLLVYEHFQPGYGGAVVLTVFGFGRRCRSEERRASK